MANHQKLLDWIENELINQNLHLGDQLPDDRELARKVGISQNHMREILKSCEEIGILRLYEGRKKSILSELVREPAVIAGPAVGLYLASSTHPQRDLVQTCLLLETHAVATVPADVSALPELDRLLAQMADPQIPPVTFHELEADFHIQLGRVSGNTLISALLASMRQAMVEARLDLMAKVPLWSNTAARLRTEHRAIVDAVRSGDPALAKTLVAANIQERFIEAKIDVNKERQVDAPSEDIRIEPVDIEDRDLLPDTWESPISPDLFDALKNIQPKPGSTPVSLASSQAPAGPAQEEAPVELAEPAAAVQQEAPQAVQVPEPQRTVLRAAPSSNARKRRGTVSAVHGGVIKDAGSQKDAPDLERIEAELRAEEERLAAERAEAERLVAERRAEEERLAAERAEAERLELEAKLRAEEERPAAERRAEEERLAAERAEAERLELEAKLRAEEERLAAERRAEEERLAAERAEAERLELEAKLRAEEERLAAEKAEAEHLELEAKLKAEEERLAALAAQQPAGQETPAQEEAGGETADAPAQERDPVQEPESSEEGPRESEAQNDGRAKDSKAQESASQPARPKKAPQVRASALKAPEPSTDAETSEAEMPETEEQAGFGQKRPARRRFDLAGYFGFRTPAPRSQQAPAPLAEEVETPAEVDDSEVEPLALPAGYEPADSEPTPPIYIDETEPGNASDLEDVDAEVQEPEDRVSPLAAKSQRPAGSAKKKKGKKKRR